MCATFTFRISVNLETSSNVLLASGVHEVQHVFDVGECLHDFTLIQNATSSAGTRSTMASGA
jgi:hypothetical protein